MKWSKYPDSNLVFIPFAPLVQTVRMDDLLQRMLRLQYSENCLSRLTSVLDEMVQTVARDVLRDFGSLRLSPPPSSISFALDSTSHGAIESLKESATDFAGRGVAARNRLRLFASAPHEHILCL